MSIVNNSVAFIFKVPTSLQRFDVKDTDIERLYIKFQFIYSGKKTKDNKKVFYFPTYQKDHFLISTDHMTLNEISFHDG